MNTLEYLLAAVTAAWDGGNEAARAPLANLSDDRLEGVAVCLEDLADYMRRLAGEPA